MFKITAYGVRPVEVPYFKKLNKYDYELNLIPEMLDADNADLAKGSDAVLARGNCLVNAENLQKFADWGIKYVFTRTVGYDHVDLKAAKKLGIKVARVPGYSPYAVAELALSMAFALFRKIIPATFATHEGDFTVRDSYFSGELHNSTVGIIGGGRIGTAEASLYAGMGCHVLVSDPHPSDRIKKVAEIVNQDKLLERADIVSLHVPYIPGVTDNLIDTKQIASMKKGAILINTARGPVVNIDAVTKALRNKQLAGYGADVLIDESNIFGHKFGSYKDIKNPAVVNLMENYPNAVITPHIGSFTEPALSDMISVSYDNFNDIINGKPCANEL